MTTKVDDDFPSNLNLFDHAVRRILAKIKSLDNEKGIMDIIKIQDFFLEYGNKIKENLTNIK